MDHKMSNLGRPQKKLRYFTQEKSSDWKIKDVFTVQDVDNLFDDLDSPFDTGNELPLLSPLPKSSASIGWEESETSSPKQPKSGEMHASPQAVLKEGITRSKERQESHLLDKDSPFKAHDPIKTSSPIGLVTEGGDQGRDVERHVTSPLLFGIEDEEPIGGDISKPVSNQSPDPVKESQGSNDETLASPPKRFVLGKQHRTRASVPSPKSEKALDAPIEKSQSSAPEITENLEIDGEAGSSAPVMTQNAELRPLEKDLTKVQPSEVKSTKEVKETAFQQKLRQALQPKSPCFRRQPSPVRVPSPFEMDDDFLILEDEAPFLFSIPRKADTSRTKSALEQEKARMADVSKEAASTESENKGGKPTQSRKGKQKQKEGAESNKADEPNTVKLRAKRKKGKAPPGCIMDISAPSEPKARKSALEYLKKGPLPIITNEAQDPTDTEEGLCDQLPSPTPPTGYADLPGKREENTSGSEQLVNTGRRDDLGVNVEAQKSALDNKKKLKKKSFNPTAAATTGQEASGPKPKSKTSKSKYDNKISEESESEASEPVKLKGSLKTNEKKSGNLASKQPKQEEGEMVGRSNEDDERPSPLSKQVTTAAEKKLKGKPPTGSAHSMSIKTVNRARRRETQETEVEIRESPSVGDPDSSPEGHVPGKRRRNKPGSWWLAIQSEDTEEQDKAINYTQQRLKTNNKNKETLASDSGLVEQPAEECSEKSAKPPSKRNAGKKSKKSTIKSDTGTDGKNPKTTRRKQKSVIVELEIPRISQNPADEEEQVNGTEKDLVLLTPPSSSPHRQHSLTSGDTSQRVFDKVYTRDSLTESTKKLPPFPLRRPQGSADGPLLEKRQRKAPTNWWEAKESQEPIDRHPLPLDTHPENLTPLVRTSKNRESALNSAKTKGCSRKTLVKKPPKTLKGSLATFGAKFTSGKLEPTVATLKRVSKNQQRRNLLHSLEDQSEQSSENTLMHTDDREHEGDGSAVDRNANPAVIESFERSGNDTLMKKDARLSSGSNRGMSHLNELFSEVDVGVSFKSGPSSMIELERYEGEDMDLPSSKTIPHTQHFPCELSESDLCGPPLRPIGLQAEDWENLIEWFRHLWPISVESGGQVITPDHFHWYAHAGRAMGHKIDLLCKTFSNGKILLGSHMKKPLQVDHGTVSVFNVMTSCVRVEINGLKSNYNPGQTFMIPCGHAYGIHNLTQQPAVLCYHRMVSDHIED